jgi:hypothetical protein
MESLCYFPKRSFSSYRNCSGQSDNCSISPAISVSSSKVPNVSSEAHILSEGYETPALYEIQRLVVFTPYIYVYTLLLYDTSRCYLLFQPIFSILRNVHI